MAKQQARDTVEDIESIIMLPEVVVAQIEQDRIKARKRENRRQKRETHDSKRPVNREREFIGWDGEGPRDAGYALFGSSEGDEICHPFLGTEECLDLILSRERENPHAIHIWFGSNYDVSMILKDLPWRHLSALKHYTQTVWKQYVLEHVPNKWFQVSAYGCTAKLYDIRSFFAGSYVSALLDMKIGTPEEIAHLTSEKARRSEFLWSEIEQIKPYMRLELKLMPELAERLREAFVNAGFDLHSWHGPGALAHMAMRKHGVYDAMAESPFDVADAARFAFAGGRFELPRGGYIRKVVYNADLHSAYPAFARSLPNLARGKWRRGRSYEPGKFAVYRIRYNSRPDPLRIFPLFQRISSGEVVWPNQCEGWYWSPEAEIVSTDSDAEFLESWVFDEFDSTDRPFAWLGEYYDRRRYLISIGSVLELTFKLIINSVYGQLAQRTGWDQKNRTAPKSHQLEWAGFITSSCRAAIYRAAISCGSALISIDTDGVYSTKMPEGLVCSDKLGDWEVKEYSEALFWQSGIYCLKKGDEWVKGRTRGIPKGKYTAEMMLEALNNGEPLRMIRKSFIGYGLALNGQRDKVNTWTAEPYEVVFGGQGKRYHNTVHWCGKRGCEDGIHEFVARPYRFNPSDSTVSKQHYLPWMGADPIVEGRKRSAADLVAFDANHLDPDDEWVLNYAS